MQSAQTSGLPEGLIGGIIFILLGCVTWFFSARRELFLKFFSRDNIEMENNAKGLLNETDFKKAFRILAIIEFVIAIIILFIGWLKSH